MTDNSNILEDILAGKISGVVIQIEGNQLARALMSVVRDAIDRAASLSAESVRNELITAQQAAEALGVCRTSLWQWEKDGILKPVRIGSRVFYRRRDINERLNNQ